MARRVGLYLRISKDPIGTHLAVERQRVDGERLIEARRWEHVDTYIDNDISAKGRRQRPDFLRLMADVREGRIDTVVSERWDRLSRNRRDDLKIVETCQPANALLAFMKGSDIDLSTASGRLTADIMSAVARNEIEVKSERQIRQAKQAAEQGRPGSIGRRAFGYTADGLHLDPVEAPILQEMYRRWLNGEGMGSIARWLQSEGWTTPRGGKWTYQNVREVLANPRNGGLRGIREVVNEKTGTRAQWHRVVGPAVWDGAVSEDTWRSAMNRIKDPDRPGQHLGENRRKHLLSGIACCWVCAKPLISGGRYADRLLRCPSLAHVSRRADVIEDYVVEVMLQRFRAGSVPLPAAVDPDVDMDAVRQEAIQIRGRVDQAIKMWMAGGLSDHELAVAKSSAERRMKDLDAQIVAAGRVDLTAPMRGQIDPEAVWDEMPLAARRELIRQTMIIRVLRGYAGRPGGLRFHPETVEIKWINDPGKRGEAAPDVE